MSESKYAKYDELPLALRVEHVMEILGVSRNTVYAMIRSKQIGSVRVGHKYIIPKDSLIAFLRTDYPAEQSLLRDNSFYFSNQPNLLKAQLFVNSCDRIR